MSLLAATAFVAGCAWGSDVEQTDQPDTYKVSQTYAPARGGIAKAKSVALEMARDKCAGLGREFYAREETAVPWPPTYEVVFSCIDVGQGS